MRRVNTQAIGSVLDDFFAQNPALADKLAEARLTDAWNTVLGRSVAQFTKDRYIKKRTLYVKLTSCILKSELMLCREQMIDKLNRHVGREVIDSVVFL
jgi:predicted nucleic acid-binding Zn ribbon protein